MAQQVGNKKLFTPQIAARRAAATWLDPCSYYCMANWICEMPRCLRRSPILRPTGGSSDHIYTLYRTSPAGEMRIHVATFDASGEAAGYNKGNCEMDEN